MAGYEMRNALNTGLNDQETSHLTKVKLPQKYAGYQLASHADSTTTRCPSDSETNSKSPFPPSGAGQRGLKHRATDDDRDQLNQPKTGQRAGPNHARLDFQIPAAPRDQLDDGPLRLSCNHHAKIGFPAELSAQPAAGIQRGATPPAT